MHDSAMKPTCENHATQRFLVCMFITMFAIIFNSIKLCCYCLVTVIIMVIIVVTTVYYCYYFFTSLNFFDLIVVSILL